MSRALGHGAGYVGAVAIGPDAITVGTRGFIGHPALQRWLPR